MPELGTVVYGRFIGSSQKYTKYIWYACEDCGKRRWIRVLRGQPEKPLCRACCFKAERNPHWKGGRPLSSGGYPLVQCWEHPKARRQDGYVFEHMLVWERTHNQTLPDGYVIHHLNGIKIDNRPRNLIALPKGKHHYAMYLQGLKLRIRELEAENKLLEKALEQSQMIFRIEEN